MEVIIRLLKESERESANEFFNRIHGGARSMDQWNWEFLNGPAGPAIYVVAVDSATNAIVGTQCAIPLELKTAEQVILTAKSEDTLVDPAYRGQKIFDRMYEQLFSECRNAGIAYLWGFTSALKPFAKLGFEIPFQFIRGYKVLDLFAAAKSFEPGAARRFGGLKVFLLFSWIRLQDLGLRRSKLPRGFSILAGDTMLSAFTQNWPIASERTYLHMDEKYCAWRLSNPGGQTYRRWQLVNANERAVAEIVISIQKKECFVEHFLVEESTGARETVALLHQAFKDISKTNVSVIRELGFNYNRINARAIEILKQAGFYFLRPQPGGNHFVWKQLLDQGVNPNALFLSKFYME